MEMRTRKFGIRLTYNGADAADEITADLLDFSYSDALEDGPVPGLPGPETALIL